MTLDPHNIENLQEIRRQLPQKLPEPDATPKKKHLSNPKLHPIETEEKPEALFKELMKASPDGIVPSHLINRLKQIEAKQMKDKTSHYSNQSPHTNLNKNETRSTKRTDERTEEDILYDYFNRFLSEDED